MRAPATSPPRFKHPDTYLKPAARADDSGASSIGSVTVPGMVRHYPLQPSLTRFQAQTKVHSGC